MEMAGTATQPGGPVVPPSVPESSASKPPITPTPLGALPSSVAYLPTRLDSLPREILQQVLSELSWRDVISCTRVSRCLYTICDSPLLWRGLCLDEYTSWHEDHLIEERLGIKETVVIAVGGTGDGLPGDVLGTDQQRLGGGRERLELGIEDGQGHGTAAGRERKTSTVLDTDWKQLFIERKLQDKQFATAFDRLLSSQDGRIDVIARITGRGEDARDLMERYRLAETVGSKNDDNDDDDNDDDDDSLARTYWANEILGSINRAQALREVAHVLTATSRRRWRGAARDRQRQQDYPLIKALWAIDYFVAESPPETLPQMLTHLDNIAAGFRAEYPGCFSSSSSSSSPLGQESRRTSRRERALRLAEFVRAHDLVGVRSPETYHDLQNSLVSVALCERDHPALPLVSHAMYCALAERVGLAAGLTNTPRHVYVTIRAPEGATLDDDDDSYDDVAPQKGRATNNSSTTAPTDTDNDELDPSRTMFLDPFHHEDEVPLSQLSRLYAGASVGMNHGGGVGGLLGFASLIAGGQNAHHHHHHPAGGQLPTALLAAALRPATTRDMMFRMANNLQETLRGSVHSLAYRTALADPTDEFVGHLAGSSSSSSTITTTAAENHDPRPRRGSIRPTILNPYRARYCAWWLQTLLEETGGGGAGLQHRALYNFVEDFMHHFKETDCPLVQDYMLAAFQGGFVVASPGAGGGEDVLGAADDAAGRDEAAFVETVLAHVKREDARVRPVKRRGSTSVTAAAAAAAASETPPDTADPVAATASSPDSQEIPQAQQQQQQHPAPAPEHQTQEHVRYRVGDVFRHRRYRYRAVITGWDATCQASEQWMQQMGVDSLPGGGRGQSFYHVLAEDHSTRYVAQENIEVVAAVPSASTKQRRRQRRRRHGRGGAGDDEGGDGQGDEGGAGGGVGDGEGDEETPDPGPPADILRIAGRYFKRWDARTGRFVSNVRDEYPDD